MTSLSVKEARQQFKKLIDAAERGESVEITRRGKRVAQIGPPKRLKPKGLPDLTAFRASIKISGEPMSQTLIKMRESERY